MSSIAINSEQGLLCNGFHMNFMYWPPPNGNCVLSCSNSPLNSTICSVVCQFMNSALRVAFWILDLSRSPKILLLTGPLGGNTSFMKRAEKSTQASTSIGCTTLLAPVNWAPPGASSPKPVRRKPSSYCLSRFSRASLSLPIFSSKSLIAVFSISWSTSSTMLPKCSSLTAWSVSFFSRRIAPPSSVSSTSLSTSSSCTLSPSGKSSCSLLVAILYLT